MATALTELPLEFSAGSTVIYERDYADYPADDGWTLKLYVAGASFTAVADGATHVLTLSATSTAALTADTYGWVERASKGVEVYDVTSGTVTITPNIAVETVAGMRTVAETRLIAVRAKIATRISADLSSYTIAQRAANREALGDLLSLERDLVAQVAAERRGNAPRPSILVGFSTPGFDR